MFEYLIKKIVPVAQAVSESKNRLEDIAGQSGYNSNTSDVQSLIINVVIYILGFLAIFFLVMVVYSGIQWIAAGGNEEVVSQAKTRLKNAIIGFGVVMISYGIITLILNAIKFSTDNSYL